MSFLALWLQAAAASEQQQAALATEVASLQRRLARARQGGLQALQVAAQATAELTSARG
jgi:hypothetical protein